MCRFRRKYRNQTFPHTNCHMTRANFGLLLIFYVKEELLMDFVFEWYTDTVNKYWLTLETQWLIVFGIVTKFTCLINKSYIWYKTILHYQSLLNFNHIYILKKGPQLKWMSMTGICKKMRFWSLIPDLTSISFKTT